MSTLRKVTYAAVAAVSLLTAAVQASAEPDDPIHVIPLITS